MNKLAILHSLPLLKKSVGSEGLLKLCEFYYYYPLRTFNQNHAKSLSSSPTYGSHLSQITSELT